MARDPSNLGALREIITVRQRGLDANGDALGPFADLFTCRAKIDANPGPTRVLAERLEGQMALEVTVRSTAKTRPLNTAMRIVWRRNGETYLISRIAAEYPTRAWVTFFATYFAGGPGG